MAPMRSHIFHQLKRLSSKRKISFWYGARSKKEMFYIEDFDQLQKENKNTKVIVQRFKGLGEMNPSQLRETAMAPGTRRLIQLELGKLKTTNEILDMLLSKKRSNDRREWLEKKGNLAEL